MKYIFVGGLSPSSVYSREHEAAKSPLQYAAENFQQAFVSGLSQASQQVEAGSIEIVSAPYFGSWPRSHSSIWIRRKLAYLSSGVMLHGIDYLNLPIIKNIFKYFNLKKEILKIVNEQTDDVIIIVYSLDLAYVASVATCKQLHRGRANLRVGLIVTDLPEFPGDCSLIYKIYLRYFEKPLIKRCLEVYDYFVVLTKMIPGALGVDNSHCIVMEGLYDQSVEPDFGVLDSVLRSGRQVVMYAGTLDERYGIIRLLDAFKEISGEPIELWVCGGGGAERLVLEAAENYSNIRFFGSLERKEVQRLQRHADLLVNPRDNEGEYNKFSFPSKLMEYMASGTPTLIYKLDGIPDSYFEHLYVVNDGSGEKLSAAVRRVLSLPSEIRTRKGEGARMYIIQNKTAKVQVRRFLDFLGVE